MDSERRHVAWPGGISDGLVSPCAICGKHTRFDYHVETELWSECVPKEMRPGVVCLSCLDELAASRDLHLDLARAIREVQFCGTGYTVLLRPSLIHTYSVAQGRV